MGLGRLIIWTGGKASIIQEALEPAFDRLDEIPENCVVPLEEGQLLEAETGDVVLAMGSKALKVLQTNKLAHGGRTVNSLRQHPIVSPKGGYYLATLDPFMVRTQADAPSLIRQDVALACRLALTGSVDPELGQYRIVEDFSDLVCEIDRRLQEKPYVELAGDTETLGLYPEAEGARIVTIQFTLDVGTADVLFVPEDGQLDEFNHQCVEWLLTHDKILLEGANWKYDSRWIRRHWGIRSTNLSRDTLLMGSMVDENRSNSLKTHAWEYTSMGGYDRLEDMGYDKGRMDLVPQEVLLPYAGADTDVTRRCGSKIKAEMGKHPSLVRLYRKVVLPASRAFEDMEHEGVCVDLEEFSKLRHELSVEIETLEETMLGLMSNRLKAKYSDNLSITRPALIRDYFFSPYGLNLKPLVKTAKSGEPSTAKAHLMMFADRPEAKEFIEALEAHGSASKTRSTFVDGFLSCLRADGRLHPTYMLFVGSMFGSDDDDAGATTGRTSCKEPAFQCMDGPSLVFTNDGKVCIQDLVSRYEAGERFKVQTHTGAWRDVVGVYRNGVRPVFRVRTRQGREINCTSNHPVLTDRGFIKAGHLHVGDAVFITKEWAVGESDQSARDAVRAVESVASGSVRETALDMQMRLRCREAILGKRPDGRGLDLVRLLAEGSAGEARPCAQGESQPAVLGLAACEKPLLQSERQGVRQLRGSRYSDVPRVARQLRDFRRGHGRASEGHVARPRGCGRPLLEEQLSMGHRYRAAAEPARHSDGDVAGPDSLCLGMGSDYRHGHDAGGTAEPRVASRESLYDAHQAAQAGYVLDEIVGLEFVGYRETYDLTIDRCHSFVADGIVVHNTIPKKTAWAKKLRACYPAPPGHLIFAADFSQGELKVVACVAEEENMLNAFRHKMDLHSVTAAEFMGISYDEFKALEKTDPYTYTLMRTGAKAGNFGLLYGMQAPGFRNYARINYGFHMTPEEAEERRHKFLYTLYPGLPVYHEDAEHYVKRHGYIESPLGRIRHLPLINSPDGKSRSDAIRQAINAPIQSTLNDLTFFALAKMREQVPELRFMGMVHDQILAYVPEDRAEEAAKAALEVMDNLPIKKELGWDHAIPFTADGELGPRMSLLKKM